jgi:mRNA interferase YafQ
VLNRIYEKKFIKDLTLAKKRGKDLNKLKIIIDLLLESKQLPVNNRNHKLKGYYRDCWECHIEPDWLLIYRSTSMDIVFVRTGTHSDLF